MADPTEVEQDDDHTESSVIKDLRAKAKRADQAEARAAELERKLAFTEAGLNGLSEKQVKALLSAHDGEITADAIKATADELGFAAKVSEAEETVDPEQAQRNREVQELSQFIGSPQASGPTDHSADVMQSIKDFQGDYAAFREFVMTNADQILGQ